MCVKQTRRKFIDYSVTSSDQRQQQQNYDDFFQTKLFRVQDVFCRALAEKMFMNFAHQDECYFIGKM